MYAGTSATGIRRVAVNAMMTLGLKWAPEMAPKA
jgi:hypothetical protein